MSESLESHVIIAETYNELVDCGYNPLDVAASLMVTAMSVYAAQLPKQEYEDLMNRVLANSNTFIEHRILH